MNYSKHQILAFTGHCDKYVKALAAIGEDFVTEDSHARVTPDEEIYESVLDIWPDMPTADDEFGGNDDE
jgi:hypothetical protein